MARMPSRSLAPSDAGSPAELTTSRILFQSGDTLFGAIRCYLHKVVTAHYPGVTNTSVLVLRPRSPSFRALVAIIASDIDTIRWAETQSTGTKMPVINWGVFQGMPSPIPSKAVAQAFEDIAGPMLDEIGVLATQIQNLRRTRDLLLPRLLSGQIDVEAMPA
jgi:type I restriction enzyme S subunit